MKRYALAVLLGAVCALTLAASGDYIYRKRIEKEINTGQAATLAACFKAEAVWQGPNANMRRCLVEWKGPGSQPRAVCTGVAKVSDPADLPANVRYEGREP